METSNPTKHPLDAICQFVEPSLAAAGFHYDGSRTFRRKPSSPSGAIDIINFQAGLGELSGRFCINLGVYTSEDGEAVLPHEGVKEYHCAVHRRGRLPRVSGLLQRLIYQSDYLRERFGVYWWPRDAAISAEVLSVIQSLGDKWFDRQRG